MAEARERRQLVRRHPIDNTLDMPADGFLRAAQFHRDGAVGAGASVGVSGDEEFDHAAFGGGEAEGHGCVPQNIWEFPEPVDVRRRQASNGVRMGMKNRK